MIDVVVSLGLASICFAGRCHPALVGPRTPTGEYRLVHARVLDPGYGGDVLAYARLADGRPLAVHRVWTAQPEQRREERLRDGDVDARRGITAGCINVMPEVYARLVECCAGAWMRIAP